MACAQVASKAEPEEPEDWEAAAEGIPTPSGAAAERRGAAARDAMAAAAQRKCEIGKGCRN